jgi:hypothetical protein
VPGQPKSCAHHANACKHSKLQLHRELALERSREITKGMVRIAGPLLVRIIRYSPRVYDDDNYVSGCKQLRDAIVRMLGRKGDSISDEIRFEYGQQKSQDQETVIEIYRETEEEEWL